MMTLTYNDLLYIRDALVERRGTMLSASVCAAKIDDNETSDVLMKDWREMGEALDRVETLIEESARQPSVPNAVSLAAIEEAKNWRALPAYKSAGEAFAAVGDDDD